MVLVEKWPFFQQFFQEIQSRKIFFTIFQNEKSPFQAIKTTSSKQRKIDIFPKGLTRGFGPKVAILLCFFILAIQAKTKCFTIFVNEKTPLQAIMTRRSKSGNKKCVFRYLRQTKKPFWTLKQRVKGRKIGIFLKGLVHGFNQKLRIFHRFILGKMCKKSVLRYSREKKKVFPDNKNNEF